MANPGERPKEAGILCHCGEEVDIIEAIGDHYRRHTVCKKRNCDHFQWVENRVTRAEEISIRSLLTANRALKAEVMTTKCTLRRYVEMELKWKSDQKDAYRWEMMWMSICVTMLAAYITLLSSTMA